MKAAFYKYQALGNDMVVIDPANFDVSLTPAAIRLICNRHFGLGADGICYGPLPDAEHPHKLRFFNPDGSEAEKSGNGLRVFARYLWDKGYVSHKNFEVWMSDTVVKTAIQDEAAHRIAMTVGRLSFNSADIPVSGSPREVVGELMAFGDAMYYVTAVTVGNPHGVIFVPEVSAEETQRMGAVIETSPHFPHRTNVQFVQVLNRHTINIEIWERGAGYTLASGTSASAAAGASIKTGQCQSPVEVHMAGGTAIVAIDPQWQVTLIGNVEGICWGNFAGDLVEKFEGYATRNRAFGKVEGAEVVDRTGRGKWPP